MGDTSNFNVRAVIPDPEVRQAIYAHLQSQYVPNGAWLYTDEVKGSTVLLGVGDISFGTVDECESDLLQLIKDGFEEVTCKVCKGKGLVPDSETETCLHCAGECNYPLPVPDFAFEVYDEPKYEWLGTIRMHVPGLPDFSGECDADGVVRPNPTELMDLIDRTTDLDELRRDLAVLTGRDHKAALTSQEST